MLNSALIRQLAKEKGLTLKELSKRVDISQQAMNQLLKKGSASLGTICKLAQELGVSEQDLLLEVSPNQQGVINTGVLQSPHATQVIGAGDEPSIVPLLNERIAALAQRIADLERLNQSYLKQIELLERQLNN